MRYSNHTEAPEGHKLETTLGELIAGGPALLAAGAHGFGPAPGAHVDFDGLALGVKPRPFIDESGEALAMVQKHDELHKTGAATKGSAERKTISRQSGRGGQSGCQPVSRDKPMKPRSVSRQIQA